MKRITIINTVSINGGDEALLRATIKGIKSILYDCEIRVLSSNPTLSNQTLKDLKFDWDWEYAFFRRDANENKLLFRLKRKLRVLLNIFFGLNFETNISQFFSSKRERRVLKILKTTDEFVLSAGGYINDFYGYDRRLATCKFINENLGKNYHIFSQSVGPFKEKAGFSALKAFFENASSVILREEISNLSLQKIKVSNSIKVSTDVAFILYEDYKRTIKTEKIENIVLCFREWQYDCLSNDNILKARRLCKHLISKYNCNLIFMSTCQGVEGYIDDSKFAKVIVNSLDEKYRSRCLVKTEKYTLKSLMLELNKYDVYIGMRLHGAILSMISGLPALNIAYESKGTGIYEDMGYSDYCFPYSKDISIWINSVDKFLKDFNEIKQGLPKVLDRMNKKALNNFNELIASFD